MAGRRIVLEHAEKGGQIATGARGGKVAGYHIDPKTGRRVATYVSDKFAAQPGKHLTAKQHREQANTLHAKARRHEENADRHARAHATAPEPSRYGATGDRAIDKESVAHAHNREISAASYARHEAGLHEAAASAKKPPKRGDAVRQEEYSWGKLVKIEKGNSHRAVVHPEHRDTLRDGGVFTDEQGHRWRVRANEDGSRDLREAKQGYRLHVSAANMGKLGL
jgi:hypothetical protein